MVFIERPPVRILPVLLREQPGVALPHAIPCVGDKTVGLEAGGRQEKAVPLQGAHLDPANPQVRVGVHQPGQLGHGPIPVKGQTQHPLGVVGQLPQLFRRLRRALPRSVLPAVPRGLPLVHRTVPLPKGVLEGQVPQMDCTLHAGRPSAASGPVAHLEGHLPPAQAGVLGIGAGAAPGREEQRGIDRHGLLQILPPGVVEEKLIEQRPQQKPPDEQHRAGDGHRQSYGLSPAAAGPPLHRPVFPRFGLCRGLRQVQLVMLGHMVGEQPEFGQLFLHPGRFLRRGRSRPVSLVELFKPHSHPPP